MYLSVNMYVHLVKLCNVVLQLTFNNSLLQVQNSVEKENKNISAQIVNEFNSFLRDKKC